MNRFLLKFNSFYFMLVLEEIFFGFSECSDFRCFSDESQICTSNQSDCTCSCRPGYYQVGENNLIGCSRVKTFGGMITTVSTFTSNQNDSVLVKNTLQVMFNDSLYFIDAEVLNLNSTVRVVAYELLFQNSAIVNATYIQNAFTSRYNCSNSNFIIPTSTGNLSVDISESCSTIVANNSRLLCGSSFRNHCDLNSTSCVAGSNGYVTCECNSDYLQVNSTFCSMTPHRCASNSDCNQPFGSCTRATSGLRSCTCTWGVEGVHCESVWLLVFTIVTVVLGFVILILVVGVVYMKRKVAKATEVTSPSYDSSIAGPKYSFSNFPPGLMRARLGDSSNNENSLNFADKAATSRDDAPVSARPDRLKQQKYSYLNLAFDGNEQNSSMIAPKKTNVELHPTNYF